MSQSKITESKGAIKSENLAKAENGESVAAALNDQHLAANAPIQQAVEIEQQAQADAADEKIEIAKKEDKDKDGRDNQNAETIQIVSETVPTQNAETVAQGEGAFAQDAEGYSFLEGSSENSGTPYALGAAEAAEAAAAGAASSGGIGATVAGLSTVAKVGLATLGAAAAAAAIDDDDDDAAASTPTPEVPTTPTGGTLLDFEGFTDNGDGTYALANDDYPVYGDSMGRGVVDSSVTGVPFEADGSTSRTMLEVTKTAGTQWWSGLTLMSAYTGSDLIGDGTEPITMRVYAEQDGTLSLELEATGATAFKQVVTVTEGWNNVSMDVSGADASVNWTTFQMRPDAVESDGTAQATTKYWIDDVHFPSATIVAPPSIPSTPTGGTLLDFEGFTDNGDGTYALTNEDYPVYGDSMGRGVVDSSVTGVPFEADGSTSRTMLEVTKTAGTQWWSGLTLMSAYTGSDLIGDGTQPITMRVYAEQDGTLSLELEATGANAFKQVVTVTEGWNNVSMDVSGADASVNWTTFQMRPDAVESDGTAQATTKYWIDDVHFPLASIVAPPAGPQEAATVPTVGAGEFDVYVATNEDGTPNGGLITNVNENWGQTGTSEIEVHPQAGAVIKLGSVNYQGMSMTATDVSAKTSFHIDIWAAEAGSTKVNLINNAGGEAGIVLAVTADQWNSFDIDLAAFGTVATDAPIHQLKFDSQSAALGDNVTPLQNFYIDNMYFGDQAATVGTPPADPSTAEFLGGGTTPVAVESDVISIFSDEYTDVEGTDFMTQYSNGLSVADVTINNANGIKKYENNEYAIIENTTDGGIDITAMSSLKFSIYKTEDTDLLIKVRDFGANGAYNAPAEGQSMDDVDDSEAAITLAANTFTVDTWNEVTITKAQLEAAGLTGTAANVANIVLDPSATETFYIDDMYWVA